jgi:SSS family solute:Na+ symporter
VTQFFPGVALGLYWKRVTMAGVFAGMITGVSVVAFLVLTKRDPFFGLNAGFFALCVNFIVTGVVSLLSPFQPSGFCAPLPQVRE